MTRFRAYSSASSSSDEEEEVNVLPKTPEKPPSRAPSNVEDEHLSESESSSGSSSSEMQEDELLPSPSPRARKPKSNALVQDENGDIRFAHEVHVRVSPPSSSSPLSSPPRTNATNRGDPTIIPWAQQVGVDAQKMHVMQTALFRMPEEAAALKAMNEPTKTPGLVLDKFVNRKHSRDSDGDGLRIDSRERASFGQDVEPQMFKPTRKYARVGITSSIANDNEGAYIDAGLAMGRSFRVGWGPGGQLVHLGAICSPSTTTTTSANSSTITLTKVLATLAPSKADTGNPSSPELASKLLQHHLSHTTISRDESNIPSAFPTSSAPTSTTIGNIFSDTPASPSYPLNFSSFAALFPSTDISSPAPIFRLGSALFDPIALHLGRSKSGVTNRSNVTPDIRNRVNVLRRKTALSKWLENDVKSIVDGDLRIQSSGSNGTYTPADAAFTQLTGHQVSQACTTTAEGGYPKLATLISQAGGDAVYKDDIRAQLEIWKSEKLAPGSNPNSQNGLVGRGVWRIYSLLCGLDTDSANRPEDDLFAGLDWKRVFGLCLWYGTTVDASVADAVAAYEHIILKNSKGPSGEIARPIPKWASASGKKGSQLPPVAGPGLGLYLGSSPRHAKDSLPDDPLYALVKLHADPALSLTSALNPRSFGPSGIDWGIGMCWHLYVILSRVMRVRDFADRGDPGVVRPRKASTPRGRASLANGRSRSGASTDSRDDDDDADSDIQVEGHSPTADLLASSYAFELESWGMVQEAAFVLLHLEGSVGREKALKDLLARSGPKLDDWMTRALVGSLKLPMTWVDEAKAMHEFDSGRFFSAYELFLSAQLYNTAHTLALFELAPDAIIRRDLELLRSLFNPFDNDGKRDKVEGWFVRGKVFLDYVETMTKLPKLLDEVAAENEDGETVPDAVQSEHIDALAKGIPRIIALLPDILHRSRTVDARHVAALEEMTKDLLKLEERARPLLLSQIHQSTLGVLDGATKINLIRGLGYARFLQSVGA